jgi:hypothetical protein
MTDDYWYKTKEHYWVVFDKRLKQLVFYQLLILSHRIPSFDKNVCAADAWIHQFFSSFIFIGRHFSLYYYDITIIIYRGLVYKHTPILISQQIDQIILPFVIFHHLGSSFSLSFFHQYLPVILSMLTYNMRNILEELNVSGIIVNVNC